MAYAYLTDPQKQFITKSGTINVSGFLRVYDASTDDLVITYKDFNGTENQADIPLDNNGRAIVIADSERVYRLEVYDRYGTLQWTTSPLWCLAAGGGLNIHDTDVISTDGSIDISKTVVGSTTTFDIGLAPSSTEFLEWCKCLNLSISNGLVYPEFAEGSMTTDEGGLHVYKDRFYHVTCTLRVDPTGNGINYDTLSATLKYSDGNEVDLVRRNYDIDNSVNDPTLCEFSYDFNCPADGYLYLYVEGVSSFEQVDVALQVHRVYSGINAVPDTCATQQWVRGYFDFNMSAHIPYSALDYDSNNEITGISGSAIAGNLNSAQVSAIASSYAESAVSSLSGSISSKLDASASAMFQPSGNYYSATNPSGFITTADMSGYANESALSSKLDASASSMFQISGDYAYNSSVSSKLDVTASSLFAPSGDYAYNSALSSYIPESASGQFAPSGNYADASSVSSKVDQSAFDDCCSAMSAAVSAKLDASASSDFVFNSSFSSYSSDVSNSITSISSVVSSKADSSALSSYQPVSAMSSYATESYVDSALSSKLDVTASSQFLTSLPDDLAYTSDVASAVSGKMDKSESSSFYPMDSNPSGYLTAHQSLAGYATEQYVDSAVSSKLDASAYDSAWFQPESSMSSWIPYSALDYSGTAISGIGGSSLAGMGGGGGADYSGVAPVNVDNDTRLISVDHRTLCVDSTMTAYNSGSSAVLGVNAAQFAPSGDYVYSSALGTGEI